MDAGDVDVEAEARAEELDTEVEDEAGAVELATVAEA